MPLPPFRDHRIPLADAVALTRRHREALPAAHRGGLFHARAVQELLGQEGCHALRIYNGRGPDGTTSFVLVAVDENGDDLTDGTVLEWAYPCPPFCSGASTLSP